VDHRLRAEADVRRLIGHDPDHLLRAAVAAAERSPGWVAGAEFYHETEEPAFVAEGFERPAFVVLHRGAEYDITFYDGFGSQFVQ
jgi:hypothetical protein